MEEMKFDMLEGYNIVGDGTPAGKELMTRARLMSVYFTDLYFIYF
jgi:hypothetical protein